MFRVRVFLEKKKECKTEKEVECVDELHEMEVARSQDNANTA